MKTELRAYKEQWNRHISVSGYRKNVDGKLFKIRDVVFDEATTLDDGIVYNSGTFCLELEAAQQLMDDLWQCGLRPSEGTGSAEAMAATQKHLEDMRKIAFDVIQLRRESVHADETRYTKIDA